MKRYFLLFLLFLPLVYNQECSVDCIRGACRDGKCSCNIEWSGEDCSKTYKDILGWKYIVYITYAIILVTLVVLSTIIEGVLTVLWKPKIEASQKIAIFLLFAGSVCRLTHDCMRANETEVLAMSVLGAIYVSSIISSMVLQVILWAELHNAVKSGIQVLNMKRARIIFISLAGISYLVDIGILIAAPFQETPGLLLTIGIVWIALLIVIFTPAFILFGCITLKHMSRSIEIKQNSSKVKRFRRVTFMISLGGVMGLCGIALSAVYLATGIQKPNEGFLPVNVIIRAIETCTSFIILFNYGTSLHHSYKKSSSNRSSGTTDVPLSTTARTPAEQSNSLEVSAEITMSNNN